MINIRCGQLSLLRTTGLLPPLPNQQVPVTCTYRINAINFQICQIRLDFTKLSLAQPTMNGNGLGGNGAFMRCNDESLTVGVNGIQICGENSGQHRKWKGSTGKNFFVQISIPVYVPINPRQGERQLEITITTRNGINGAMRPDWNIAVHQLECPFGQTRSFADVVPTEFNEIPRSPRTLVSDWLAPPGCLQYFVQPTGQIETFNFNNGAGQFPQASPKVQRLNNFPSGPYIGNMDYAICFRRPRGAVSLK